MYPFSGRIWLLAISAISPEHSPIVVDYRLSAICGSNRRVSADVRAPNRAQIYCVCACVWRRSRSRSVQRRSHQRSRRVNWFRAREYTGRARACTHQEQRRRGRRERERRKSSERARKKGKEEEKESDRPRGRSHPEFEVGGRTCNRVS